MIEMSFSNTKISAESQKEIDAYIGQYPADKIKSALLPVLHIVQNDNDGWLSPESMDYVANILNIKPIEVYEVATFYSMFHTEPVGKILIEVCHTGPCMICGAENIIKHIENKLNIKVGGTSADGMFTLKGVECLGACGYAPMFQIGEQYYEHLTTEKVDEILNTMRSEKLSQNA
jgi:NADH-quinone oxidoreductase subunit E